MASKSTSAVSTSGAAFRSRSINAASFRGGDGLFFFLAMQTSQTEDATVLDCPTAEAAPSEATSASCYDQVEYVRIRAIVKPELKLIQVEWQISFADFVIAAHDAALEKRPERFNRIGVRRTYYVFALTVTDYAMIVVAAEQAIARVFIGREQLDAGSIRDLTNETIESGRIGVLDHLADHVSFPADRADDGNLAVRAGFAVALALVLVRLFPADVRLVSLDLAQQLREIVFHCSADARAHIPRGFVRAGSHHAMNLVGTNSLLCVAHDEHDLKPRAQRILSVLENRFRDDAEPVAVASAAILALTNPVEGPMRDVEHFRVGATRALDNAIRPPLLYQKPLAIVLSLKCGQQLIERLHANNIAFCACGVNRRIIPFPSGKGNRTRGGENERYVLRDGGGV